jgi:hypothetical protein
MDSKVEHHSCLFREIKWRRTQSVRHAVQAPCTGRTERKRPVGLDVVWLVILKGIWNWIWLFGLDEGEWKVGAVEGSCNNSGEDCVSFTVGVSFCNQKEIILHIYSYYIHDEYICDFCIVDAHWQKLDVTRYIQRNVLKTRRIIRDFWYFFYWN